MAETLEIRKIKFSIILKVSLIDKKNYSIQWLNDIFDAISRVGLLLLLLTLPSTYIEGELLNPLVLSLF